MDLFLHPENQTILWQTIQLSESWPAFEKQRPVAEWFKKTMEEAYLTYSPFYDNKPMTTEELRVLNRRVVLVMMQEMHACVHPTKASKQHSSPQQQQQQQHPSQQQQQQHPSQQHSSQQHSSQQHSSKHSSQQQQQQQHPSQQAGTAFQRAPPPPIDFSADDNASSQRLDSNRLDELVKSQMAQRQAELEQFHPSPNDSSSSYASY